MKFKIGDKVKYVSMEYEDGLYNPLWGGKYGYIVGTIYEVTKSGFQYHVEWDNGATNDYKEIDLEFVDDRHLIIDEIKDLFEL